MLIIIYASLQKQTSVRRPLKRKQPEQDTELESLEEPTTSLEQTSAEKNSQESVVTSKKPRG